MLSRREFLRGMLAGGTLLLAGERVFAASGRTLYCPILMYHYVSTPPNTANATLRDLAVVPELFAAQLDHLAEQGYQTVTMTTLYRALLGEALLPAKPCVLTFDDGHWDAMAIATPNLLAREMVGTFYVVKNFIGAPDKLSWGHVQEMARLGMEIGCHSAAHVNLTQLTYRQQLDDIARASDAIAEHIDSYPRTFCYPFGLHNRSTRRILRQLGYQTAVTTSHSTLHHRENRLVLGRVRVRGGMSPEALVRLLT